MRQRKFVVGLTAMALAASMLVMDAGVLAAEGMRT